MITKQEAYETLRQIVTENPDNVNPTNAAGFSCLYWKRTKTGTQRCLIGELGHRLGLPQPPANAGSVQTLTYLNRIWGGVFTEATREFLYAAQRYADTGHTGFGPPNPIRWGDIHLSTIR